MLDRLWDKEGVREGPAGVWGRGRALQRIQQGHLYSEVKRGYLKVQCVHIGRKAPWKTEPEPRKAIMLCKRLTDFGIIERLLMREKIGR